MNKEKETLEEKMSGDLELKYWQELTMCVTQI